MNHSPPGGRGGFHGGYDDVVDDYDMPPARNMGMGNGAGPGNRSSTQVTIPKDVGISHLCVNQICIISSILSFLI